MPSRQIRSTLRQTLIQQDINIQKEVKQEMVNTATEVKQWLVTGVRTWKNKPQFRVQALIRPDRLIYDVIPIGKNRKIFLYVDRGTGKYGAKKRAYDITPKTAKALVFKTNYRAKTATGGKFFAGSGRATGPTIRVKKVTHPGIKPRKFSETALESLIPPLHRRIENAFRRGARRNA